ncbi:MAG: glycoside hydrolase family 127 protein, partial [Anaerolineae bacterium]|nr:glycoside hydrolase family 127 protein [Anaerolineae bacterium]
MSLSGQNTTARAVIVDTSQSEYARLRPVSITAVRLEDEFWQRRRKINREVMLPAQYDLCERTGRIDNFRWAAGKLTGGHQGAYFNDSDVYKLLESASWALAGTDDPDLKALVDNLIEDIASAQQPDGYINTYFMGERASERWQNFDLHEMYCAGHLIQAAVAHYRSTG